MGRPSKLTDDQWNDIKRRLLGGEKAADLSREYGVSKTAISVRVSKRIETVKEVANQLVSAESALRNLPVSEQIAALNLAEDLRSISKNLAGAARMSSATAFRLASVANEAAQAVDDAEPLGEDSAKAVKTVMVLSAAANEASKIGLNLLAANKGRVERLADDDAKLGPDGKPRIATIPADPLEAARVYRELMGG